MYFKSLAIFAGLSTLAAAAPSGVTKEPCAQLSQVYQQQLHKHPDTTASVSGELVHKCMQSIPFDAKRATAFIPELKKYLQFQSTTEILKNPPPGYLGAPVDLFGGLDHISQLAADNKYANQNDFDNDLYNLLASAHDGHLYVKGLCSHQSFLYNISMPVISVSNDGLQLPEIYSANDAALLGNNSHRVSPVVSVNGQEAVSFFKDQASKQNPQDPDARYNSVFKTFARSGLMSSAIEGLIEQSYVWPGQSKYTFEFGNGTVRDVETKAIPLQKRMDFNFPNGKALFNTLCVPENKASSSATPTPSSSSLRSTPTPSSSQLPRQPVPTMLPKPVMREPENHISGYYLHEKGLRDVAVLLVPTFNALGAEALSFSNHAANFIKQAVADGKKKLVIDVTGNPGGSVYAGYDLFKLLFPNKPIYAASRFRTHEAIDLLGRSFETITDDKYLPLINGFAVAGSVTPNQTYNFQSWPELYGPQHKLGTNVSSLYASNFSIVSTGSTPVHGYGDFKTNHTAPPFKPEDILIVTDGFCASTCTVFSENLKWQGVKSLAFGGQPQYGPMQAIGGVKGAQAAETSTFKSYEKVSSLIQQSSAEDDDPVLSTEQMKRYNETAPGLKTPSLPISDVGVNLLNQYGPGDDSVPLQFVYEPADCRLFYTLENINEPATIWSTAARTYWGKGQCVPGSNKESNLSTTVSVSLSLSLSSATPSAIPSSNALF